MTNHDKTNDGTFANHLFIFLKVLSNDKGQSFMKSL